MKNAIKKIGISLLVGTLMTTSIPGFPNVMHAPSYANEATTSESFAQTLASIDTLNTKEDFYTLLSDIVYGLNYNGGDLYKLHELPKDYSEFDKLLHHLEKKAKTFKWATELEKKMFLSALTFERLQIKENPIAYSYVYPSMIYYFIDDAALIPKLSKEEWEEGFETEETHLAILQTIVLKSEDTLKKDGALPYFINTAYFNYSLPKFKSDLIEMIENAKLNLNAMNAPETVKTRLSFFEKAQVDKHNENIQQRITKLEKLLQITEKSIAFHEANDSARIDKKIYKNLTIPLVAKDFITPEEITKIGNSEVTRIQAELSIKLNELGYKGQLKDQITQFKADSKLYEYDEAVPLYLETMNYLKTQLHKYFYVGTYAVYLPEIIPNEGASSAYSSYNSQGLETGTFYLATEPHPDYDIETLTVHETMLGHHLYMQNAYVLNTPVPYYENQATHGFVEGWALYAEKLAREEGLIRTDKGYVGSLLRELLRAGRLVADVGINYYDWSDKKALDYLTQETFFLYPESEVKRYKSNPGQALAYKLGELKFIETRENLKKRLGKAFNLKDFHYEILEYPGVPLYLFEDLVADLKP